MMTTSTAFSGPVARHIGCPCPGWPEYPWAPVPPQPEPVLSLEPELQGAGELSPPPWPLAPQGSQGAIKCHESSRKSLTLTTSLCYHLHQADGKPEQPDAAGWGTSWLLCDEGAHASVTAWHWHGVFLPKNGIQVGQRCHMGP